MTSPHPVEYNDFWASSKRLDDEGPLLWQLWMIFGQDRDDPNLVDIDTPSGVTVVHKIPRDKAEALVALHDSFMEQARKLIRE